MLAQTNLQLYRQLLDAQWPDADLATTRAAYELARQLFVHCHRPSQKPFLCHLVGAASALVAWEKQQPLVWAGLLHSAYLYGDWADGERGDSLNRRHYLASIVGEQAEQYIHDYTHNKHLSAYTCTDADLQAIKLADLLDELTDAGPRFAPGKPLLEITAEALACSGEGADKLIALAERMIGPIGGEMFREALQVCAATQPPAALQSELRSFQTVPSGVDTGPRLLQLPLPRFNLPASLGRNEARLRKLFSSKRAAS